MPENTTLVNTNTRRTVIADQRDQLLAETRENLLVLENQELKQNWETFAHNWSSFLDQSQMNHESLTELLIERLHHLEASNEILCRHLNQYVGQYTQMLTQSAEDAGHALQFSADTAVNSVRYAAESAKRDITAASDTARNAVSAANRRAKWSLLALFICPITLAAGLFLHFLGLL